MRLIDADALKVYHGINVGRNFGGLRAIVFKRDIDHAPTIEAEPIKHAKPIVYYHGENTFSYECGVCRMPIDGTDYYCRWCGAKVERNE